MIQYLDWRVVTGRHQTVGLSLLLTRHIKFTPIHCFGIMKRKYRVNKINSLYCLKDVVNAIFIYKNVHIIVRICPILWLNRFPKFPLKKKIQCIKVQQFPLYRQRFNLQSSYMLKSSCRTFLNSVLADAMPQRQNLSSLDLKRQEYLFQKICP